MKYDLQTPSFQGFYGMKLDRIFIRYWLSNSSVVEIKIRNRIQIFEKSSNSYDLRIRFLDPYDFEKKIEKLFVLAKITKIVWEVQLSGYPTFLWSCPWK